MNSEQAFVGGTNIFKPIRIHQAISFFGIGSIPAANFKSYYCVSIWKGTLFDLCLKSLTRGLRKEDLIQLHLYCFRLRGTVTETHASAAGEDAGTAAHHQRSGVQARSLAMAGQTLSWSIFPKDLCYGEYISILGTLANKITDTEFDYVWPRTILFVNMH